MLIHAFELIDASRQVRVQQTFSFPRCRKTSDYVSIQERDHNEPSKPEAKSGDELVILIWLVEIAFGRASIGQHRLVLTYLRKPTPPTFKTKQKGKKKLELLIGLKRNKSAKILRQSRFWKSRSLRKK
jgi:hypothetical protein